MASNNIKNNIFKGLTGIGGVYHVVLGLCALLLPAKLIGDVSQLFLGFSLTVDDQLMLIAKFVGAYLLVFGVVLLFLAANPVKYRILLFPALLLFGIRAFNKIVFFGSITAVYNVSSSRNIFSTGILLVLFLGILLTAPRKAQA